jgi:hypothetical protein
MRLVVRGFPITHHGHDVGERHAGAVVLIGVEEDTETLEFVCRTEDRALCGALLGEPKRKPITVQIAIAVDLELELDLASKFVSFLRMIPPRGLCVYLPIGRSQRHAGGDPSLLRWPVSREANISEKKATVSTRAPEKVQSIRNILTCRRGLLYLLRSRTSGFGNPNRGMAVKDGQH